MEPACGTGNFLVEILNRKLAVVAKQYKKSQLEYERTAVLAVSSLYGIDITWRLAKNACLRCLTRNTARCIKQMQRTLPQHGTLHTQP
jgi:hypothetical protein